MAVITKKINILPAQKRYKTQIDLKEAGFKYGIPALIFCVLLYVALTLIPQISEIAKITKKIKAKQAQSNKLEMEDIAYQTQKEKINAEIEELKVKSEALQKNTQLLKKEMDEKVFWEDVLVELARSMPDHLWIGSISKQQNYLIIKGYTQSDSMLGTFMSHLDNSPLFANTQFVSSEKIKEDDKEQIVIYELKCDIVKNPVER